jgi:glycosyltransferase involved in cell wall biosynthesis
MGVDFKCVKNGCVSLSEYCLHKQLLDRTSSTIKRVVSLFHCPSRHLYESANSLGFTPARYIPLGIDPAFSQVPLAGHRDHPVVLFVGALVEQKGPHFLIEAFEIVKRQVPDAKLVFAGRGPSMEALKEQASRTDFFRDIEFLGFLGRTEVVSLYQRAHVFVIPSIWKEQFGLVGPEALACGVPCVGTDLGGIPEWLHDSEWGFLGPPRDVEALAERISKLLLDRAMRVSFGKRGREFTLNEYSASKYKDSMLLLVKEYARDL